MNTRKAFVDQILLWFVIGLLVFGFVATVSDDNNARVKYQNLKSITDHAAYAAAEYYTNNFNTVADDETGKTESAAKATYIVKNQTSKLANEVPIVYTWDFSATPYKVTATITTHTHENFWWKLFNWDDYVFTNVSSTARFDVGEADNFVPLAINTCGKGDTYFEPGQTFEYLLKAHDVYEDDDFIGLYGLYYYAEAGQSPFAKVKNIIASVLNSGGENSFSVDDDMTDDSGNKLSVANVPVTSIENDVSQIISAFDAAGGGNMLGFPETQLSMALLDCGSTSTDLNLEKLITIKAKSMECGIDYIPGSMAEADALPYDFDDGNNYHIGDYELGNKEHPEYFDQIEWSDLVNKCTSSSLFKFTFETVNSTNIILED
jgi:hypothetical protein